MDRASSTFLGPVAYATASLAAADGSGERLHLHRWRPTRVPVKAVFALVHGLGEHAGSYGPFVSSFAARGAAIYAVDNRGFGRSEGRRGHIAHADLYVQDALTMVRRARDEQPGVPVVLVGHSMGGTIALLLALDHPDLFDLAVYSAPALRVSAPAPPWQRTLGKTMSRVYPLYTTVRPSDPTLLTHDVKLQKETATDKLRHGRITARLYTEMFIRAPRLVWGRASDLRIPFLLLHGEDDPLVPVASSRDLLARVRKGRDIGRLVTYPHLRHELFREVERDGVFEDVAHWLGDHGVLLHEGGATSRPPGAASLSTYVGRVRALARFLP